MTLARSSTHPDPVAKTIEKGRDPSSLTQVIGALSCNLGEENMGQACVLKITESKSGKILTIQNESEAMKLYFSGTKQAQIEGTMIDNETIHLVRANPAEAELKVTD